MSAEPVNHVGEADVEIESPAPLTSVVSSNLPEDASPRQHRINKRQVVVEALRKRYENIVPEYELKMILPDPAEDIAKRAWETKMFVARTKVLALLEVEFALFI